MFSERLENISLTFCRIVFNSVHNAEVGKRFEMNLTFGNVGTFWRSSRESYLFCDFMEFGTVQKCANIGDPKKLEHEHFLATIGFDKAEYEPPKLIFLFLASA